MDVGCASSAAMMVAIVLLAVGLATGSPAIVVAAVALAVPSVAVTLWPRLRPGAMGLDTD